MSSIKTAILLISLILFGTPSSAQKTDATQDRLRQAVELEKNNKDSARQAFTRLLPEVRRSPGSIELATVLQHLSVLDLNAADYPAAVAHAKECSELFEELHDAVNEISCGTVIGRAQTASGLYADAAATGEKMLDVARSKGLAEAHVSLLNNSGNIDLFLGRYDKAFRKYKEAEGLLAVSTGQPWYARRRTVTLANLATLYQRLGQYERALRMYSQIRDSAQPLPSGEQGQVLENSGTLLRRLGDPYKALQFYAQAGVLFEAAHDIAGQISIAKNTGIALALGLGHLDEAVPMFQQALNLAVRFANQREIAQAALYEAETLRRSGKPEAAAELFREALSVSRKIGSGEDEWKALYGLGQLTEISDRAAALRYYQQAIVCIEKIRVNAGPPAQRTGFLADKRDVYDAAIRLLLLETPISVSSIFDLLEKAKARSFQDVLPSTGDLKLSSIQERLPPRTLLLDYWLSEDQLAVIWVSNSAWGVSQSRAPTKLQLTNLSNVISIGASSDWRSQAAQLSREILPFAKPDAERLIVIPDGQLQSIPFEVLSASGNKAGRLLIEDYTVSYLPAAALLLNPRPRRAGWIAPWTALLEGFADPRTRVDGPANPMFSADRLVPLTSSAEELRSASRLLGGKSRLHIGAENRKEAFLHRSIPNAPVLHLATHAIADSDDPDRSRLAFSPLSPGAPADYLFARELYSANLKGVDLALLSACDTERGTTIRGEGVQSLSRALLAAGAQSSITTLWRVGDVTGKRFSDRLYAHLAKGEPVAEALRAVKLEFYNSAGPLAHPSYWSLYILNGNPLVRIPRSVPWAAIVGFFFLLAALCFTLKQKQSRG